MGTCTGITSMCSIGGFALETRCHLGQVVLYDTVKELGWSVDIRNHGIKLVVDKLLADDSQWATKAKESQGVPSTFNWGWGHKKQANKTDEEVPRAKNAIEVEGVDGECMVCCLWLLFS